MCRRILWIACGRLPMQNLQGTGPCSRLSPPVPGPHGCRGHTYRRAATTPLVQWRGTTPSGVRKKNDRARWERSFRPSKRRPRHDALDPSHRTRPFCHVTDAWFPIARLRIVERSVFLIRHRHMVEEDRDKTGWNATYMAGPMHVTNTICVMRYSVPSHRRTIRIRDT